MEYRKLRGTPAIEKMLHDARTLNAYGMVSVEFVALVVINPLSPNITSHVFDQLSKLLAMKHLALDCETLKAVTCNKIFVCVNVHIVSEMFWDTSH